MSPQVRTRRTRRTLIGAAVALLVVAALAVLIVRATAGPSSTQQAATQCQKLRQEAEQYAQQFGSSLPGQVPQGQLDQLAQSTYQATAASNHLPCP